MPQTPDLSRYLDAGAQFVALTRAEARRRAKELVATGQLAQGQVQAFVDDLVEESRRRTDELADVVRKEIQRQVKSLGIATKEDLAKLETKLAKDRAKPAKAAGKRAGSGKQAAKKSAKSAKSAEKAAAKRAKKPATKAGSKAKPSKSAAARAAAS
jgi:polyhydroxyalkanoate synthesis regulator phasin